MTAVTVKALQRLRKKSLEERPEATSENRTSYVGADCSKYGQQHQDKPSCQRWTTVFNRHSVTLRKHI